MILSSAQYEFDGNIVAFQTEGFDGFTLELWSQLGGNKRKRVTVLKRDIGKLLTF